MWDVIAFALVVAVVFGLGAYRSFKHGELGKFIDFMKLASKANDDLFGGETKTFVVATTGAERTIKVKTINDAISHIFASATSLSTLYFGPQRESGLHLEYSVYSEHNDDFMRLTEKEGEEVINTSEFNLDKMGPVPAVDVLISLIGRMGTSPTTWWDEAALEAQESNNQG